MNYVVRVCGEYVTAMLYFGNLEKLRCAAGRERRWLELEARLGGGGERWFSDMNEMVVVINNLSCHIALWALTGNCN